MKLRSYAVICVAALAAGCVALPGPGAQEGSTPPKLVMKNDSKTWDDPRSFGPVPLALSTAAANVCSSLNTKEAKFVAKGYHSKAQDMDGKSFTGGGYYCVRD